MLAEEDAKTNAQALLGVHSVYPSPHVQGFAHYIMIEFYSELYS